MHTDDALAHLDHQLDELQSLAELSGDQATQQGVGRLRFLLALLEDLRTQPALIPDQKVLAP